MAPDDPDLRERVAELEQTVEQQQETIHQLLPSRRRVLQAGGLVAGGGVLGALTADRASAQASGQVGTSSDPVDVEAFDLGVQNQLSSSVDAGGNDLTNVGSLSTTDINVTEFADNTTRQLIAANDGSYLGGIIAQKTLGVSTAAEVILEPPQTGTDARIHTADIFARQDGGGKRFADTVKFSRDGSATAVDKTAVRLSPDGRTYATSKRTGLTLAMSADTYNVFAIARGVELL